MQKSDTSFIHNAEKWKQDHGNIVVDYGEEAEGNLLEYWKCLSCRMTQVCEYLCENKYSVYMKINFELYRRSVHFPHFTYFMS